MAEDPRKSFGHLRFPDRPPYRARTACVRWEPMMGSGERLTAVIGAVGADGRSRVIQAIRAEVLEAAFGESGRNARWHFRLVGESLGDHLARYADFAGWVPPLGGFWLEAAVDARAEDFDGALRQAVSLRAAFGSLERFDVLAESAARARA